MVGDLHCHTNYSDGSMQLEHIILYAKQIGLDCLAITDHDTMGGTAKAVLLGEKIGVKVIPGMEMSCYDPDTGRKVHLLCYFPLRPEALRPLLDELLKSRSHANRESIRLMQQYHPITEEMVVRHAGSIEQVQKCHIMHALLDLGLDYQIYGEMYRHHFSPGAKEHCYYPTQYINIHDAVRAVRESGGISVMAHPGEYNSIELLDKLSSDGWLDGAEVYHPAHSEEQRRQILDIARRDNLIITGGTDFHGYYSVPSKINPLGSFTTDNENIERIFALYYKRMREGFEKK
ncbi:MAG: PHP domain-containing protein [Oscillospiraceae bacterium]|nr:PHP domain-containing protein [Oscillospiraceae bacterium]